MIPVSPRLPFSTSNHSVLAGSVSPVGLGGIGCLLLPTELSAMLRYWLILLLSYSTKRQGVEISQSLWVMYSVQQCSPDVFPNVQTKPNELWFVATAHTIINYFMRKSSPSLKLALGICRQLLGCPSTSPELTSPAKHPTAELRRHYEVAVAEKME